MTLIHEVNEAHFADMTVEVVSSQGCADLLVHKTESSMPSMHNEGVWCFVGKRAISSKAVHFTHRPGPAHLRICYVRSPGLSGWLKNHKLKGRLR